MKKDIKVLWMADLRSGEHTQGVGLLCKGDAYCCLGRLCELAVEAGVTKASIGGHGVVGYDGEESILPESVRLWAGLSTPTAEYGAYSLSNDNDKGKTFAEIADIIEREF